MTFIFWADHMESHKFHANNFGTDQDFGRRVTAAAADCSLIPIFLYLPYKSSNA
jgi:hypothetical protein